MPVYASRRDGDGGPIEGRIVKPGVTELGEPASSGREPGLMFARREAEIGPDRFNISELLKGSGCARPSSGSGKPDALISG